MPRSTMSLFPFPLRVALTPSSASPPDPTRCSGGGRRRPSRGQPSHHSNHSALAEHRGKRGWERGMKKALRHYLPRCQAPPCERSKAWPCRSTAAPPVPSLDRSKAVCICCISRSRWCAARSATRSLPKPVTMRDPGPCSTAGPNPPAHRTSSARAGRLITPPAIVADGRCAVAVMPAEGAPTSPDDLPD